MNIRSRIPRFLFFTSIFTAEFGMAWTIFVRPDFIGLSAITVPFIVYWIAKRFNIGKYAHAGRTSDIQKSKWPVELASVASDSFEAFSFCPPLSYVGYTEYFAMSGDINDDLEARLPAEQYALLGFGNGFLQKIRNRFAEHQDCSQIQFHVINASQHCKELIGWLGYLQMSGRDNAGPSTGNLHNVIQANSKDICSRGPIIMKFLDKYHNGQSEPPYGSAFSSETLKEWKDIYEAAFAEGQRQGLRAVIVATTM